MNFRGLLCKRIFRREILYLCSVIRNSDNDRSIETLYNLVADDDDRVAYNALWIFSHLTTEDSRWLLTRRNELIDQLLVETHVGKERLILTLLERQSVEKENIRTDYLDFCLSSINSAKPYAIRALCLKQAFAQCRHYPELVQELIACINMMEPFEISPGLRSARNNILKQLAKSK